MRPRGLRTLAVLLAGLAETALAGTPYTIAAHWVRDTGRLQPQVGDFAFYDLNFSPNGNGWLGGDRFLLNITSAGLHVTFVNDSKRAIYSAASLETGEAWAGGCQFVEVRIPQRVTSEGLLWHYRSGEWQPVDLSYLGLHNWCIHAVRFAGMRDGWALATRFPEEWPFKSESEDGGFFLHFDGAQWSVDRSEGLATVQRRLSSLCLGPSGQWWAAGRMRINQQRWQGFLLLHRGDAWQDVPSDISTSSMSGIACVPDGSIVVSALDDARPARPLVLRFQMDRWEKLDLPEQLRGYWVGPVAAPAAGDLWVAASAPNEPTLLLRSTGGSWQVMPGPVLPGGRRGGYSVTAIQFVSPTEGWAIAQDSGGPDLVRGLVFHYKDGVWENWNWNWHFWDARWFGLLGH